MGRTRDTDDMTFTFRITCTEWDIMVNTKKFGKDCTLPNLVLDGKDIEWVKTWSYLGVTLKSHKSFMLH